MTKGMALQEYCVSEWNAEDKIKSRERNRTEHGYRYNAESPIWWKKTNGRGWEFKRTTLSSRPGMGFVCERGHRK